MKSIIPALAITLLNINLHILPPAHLFWLVGIAITLDFVTGLAKAVTLNQARTSNGYRKTVRKFIQYGGSISVALMLRYLLSKQPELSEGMKYADWLGNGIMIFIVLIECTSIMENMYAIDKTSMFSRYLIKPLLKVLTLQIKNNPINKTDNTKGEET